jgi:hypothetical protein
MEISREQERASVFGLKARKPVAASTVSVILFTAGGRRFAVEAAAVMEIREHDESSRLRRLQGIVRLDFARQVGLGSGILAKSVVLKPGECWLMVADVERIAVQPRLVALPRLFSGTERQWYRGLLLLEKEVVPLVRTEYWRTVGMQAAEAR